jgi:hypothetical protein
MLVVGVAPRPEAQPTEGAISGRATDATGATLVGVLVELQITSTETRHTYTDTNGRYAFAGVSPGRTRLTFRHPGFAVHRHEVWVAPGEHVAVDVELRLAFDASATVTGTDPTIPIDVLRVAQAASDGIVDAAAIRGRPLERPLALLESVPGLIAVQHGGEGKAGQYAIRGIDVDHGSDLALTVDGVPVNMPTHAHGQGYADLNFIVPELIDRLHYRKGPYAAEDGDFAAIGAVDLHYTDEVRDPLLRAEFGAFGARRLLLAGSPARGAGRLLAAFEAGRSDGPWTRPDDARRLNGVLRYSRRNAGGRLAVTALGYWSRWHATHQVPARAVAGGVIPRFGHIEASDGGRTRRASLSVERERIGSNRRLQMNGFVVGYALGLFSNFTYFLRDPANGDQFEQVDRRVVWGGRIVDRRLLPLVGRRATISWGIQARHDAVGRVGLYATRARARRSTLREDRAGQTSVGLFAQGEVEWREWFRTVAGIRADGYLFTVAGKSTGGGRRGAGLLGPKLSAILRPRAGVEVYANAGLGFHSNDARAVVVPVVDGSGPPRRRATPLARLRGAEIGVRAAKVGKVEATAVAWILQSEAETVYVADEGTVEANRPGRRTGVELSGRGVVSPSLTVHADASLSRARFADSRETLRVPGSVERSVSVGAVMTLPGALRGSLWVRHVGPRPLVEDGEIRSDGSTLVNAEIGRRLGSRLRLSADVFNLLDSRASAIAYFYRSRLPGEPVEGVEDVHAHPVLPRSVRLTLQVTFGGGAASRAPAEDRDSRATKAHQGSAP